MMYQKCPVCDGRGVVPHNFYTMCTVSSSTAPEKCRTCGGHGILWDAREEEYAQKYWKDWKEK